MGVMTFAEAVRKVGIPDPDRLKSGTWDAHQADYPSEGPEFLKDGYLTEALDYARIPGDIRPPFFAAATAIRASEAWSRLAWHCRHLLFGTTIDEDWWGHNLVIPGAGETGTMFPAVVLLAGLPGMREFHRKRGIPEEVTLTTLSDIEIWVRHHKERFGTWGFNEIGWLMHHFTGRLYRLGRLQFIHKKYDGAVRLYRNKAAGDVVLLSLPGIKYRADGQVDGNNGREDPAGKWTSAFEATATEVRGNRISEKGAAQKEPATLSRSEWSEILTTGDGVLDIHIAAGEPMALEPCRESARRATEFFPRYFPEAQFRGFMCSSWLLDPMYLEILPPSSNIVQFIKWFHIYPIHSDDHEAFKRIFGGRPADLTKAPRDSGLRRAILDLYVGGGSLHGAAGGVVREFLK